MLKLLAALLPLFFVSCATITRGVHDKLYVNSQPSGAEATLSTGERAVTPAKFIKKRRASFTVTVSKPGYQSQTVKVESKFSPTGGTAVAGNIVAGGLIGAVVDASTGAASSLYPNPVSVQLVPQRIPPPKKAPAKKKTKAKKRTERAVDLEPVTSRPSNTTSRPEHGSDAPPASPSLPPNEPRILESVETPKPSPSP